MATLSISFTPVNPAPANGYMVYYRPKGSGAPYTTAIGTSSPINITVTDGTIDYEGVVQSRCQYQSSPTTPWETGNNLPNLVWIPFSQSCEKENAFGIVKVITGLSSPANVWYDTVTSKVFVADLDDTAGNVYWFNPNTAVNAADMIHSTAVNDRYLYNNAIDPIFRRIYFVGKESGGLLVYDIDTNTTSVVAFGTNGIPYSRGVLLVTSSKIYCNDGANSIVIIDRTSLTITTIIPKTSIPGPGYFSLNIDGLIEVGNQIWVCAGSGNSNIGTIGVFNPLFTTNIDNIVLPGQAIWTGGTGTQQWQSIFFDQTSNQVYVCDFGSNRRYVINAFSRTILDTRVVENLEGKTNLGIAWTIDPLSNKLYAAYGMVNNPNDIPINRMYEEDRTTFKYLKIFPNQYYTRLMPINGQNKSLGVNTGLPFWATNPSSSTDGTITVISNGLNGGNTGFKLTTVLQEVNANANNAPTGQTKPNNISDPDYISPMIDTTTCPIVYTLDCPTSVVKSYAAGTLNYEFSILNSVKTNSAIAKIQVRAYNTDGSLAEGAPIIINAPFSSAYFSGSIAGLTGSNYTTQVIYLDSSLNQIQVCIS